jgi:hypothetical protein
VRRVLALVALFAATVVGSASAVESTIIRGVGIGKVRVGMTRGQVERLLGKDHIVNAQTSVADTTYVELGWDFSTFAVGFLKSGTTYRVAQVETTLQGEKTTKGIGVGSSFRAVVREYPQAICGAYFTSMGSSGDVTIGPNHRSASTALVVAQDRKQLAFLVHPAELNRYSVPWVVFGVIVRNSIPGAIDFRPSSRCQYGWQTRGRP